MEAQSTGSQDSAGLRGARSSGVQSFEGGVEKLPLLGAGDGQRIDVKLRTGLAAGRTVEKKESLGELVMPWLLAISLIAMGSGGVSLLLLLGLSQG